MGAGSSIGAGIGAVAGTLLLPGVGTVLGASLGGAIGGAGDAVAGAAKINKAKKAAPLYVDPQEQEFNSVLENMRKGINTGAGYAEAIRQLNKTQQINNNSILGASAGNGGAAIYGINQQTDAIGDQYGKIFANNQQHLDMINQQYAQSVKDMAVHKRDMDQQNYDQLMADGKGAVAQGLADTATGLVNATGAGFKTGDGTSDDGTGSGFDLSSLLQLMKKKTPTNADLKTSAAGGVKSFGSAGLDINAPIDGLTTAITG